MKYKPWCPVECVEHIVWALGAQRTQLCRFWQHKERGTGLIPKPRSATSWQGCGEETLKQATSSNNRVKKRLLQVQALLSLALCGTPWSCFAWDSKDSKVSSAQGSQRLNKFKMTCPASWGVMPLCMAFCAEHSFLVRAFIDGIVSIYREREDWFALTEHKTFLLGYKHNLLPMQRTVEILKIKLYLKVSVKKSGKLLETRSTQVQGKFAVWSTKHWMKLLRWFLTHLVKKKTYTIGERKSEFVSNCCYLVANESLMHF